MAELRNLLIDNDFKIGLSAEIHGGLTREKIDDAIAAAGVPLPLKNQVSFTLYDTTGTPRMFLCTWFPEHNFYAVTKMQIKI